LQFDRAETGARFDQPLIGIVGIASWQVQANKIQEWPEISRRQFQLTVGVNIPEG
jgi:hypothetical protein